MGRKKQEGPETFDTERLLLDAQSPDDLPLHTPVNFSLSFLSISRIQFLKPLTRLSYPEVKQ